MGEASDEREEDHAKIEAFFLLELVYYTLCRSGFCKVTFSFHIMLGIIQTSFKQSFFFPLHLKNDFPIPSLAKSKKPSKQLPLLPANLNLVML